MSKHTPGPWVTEPSKPHGASVANAMGCTVAWAGSNSYFGESHYSINRNEAKANVRLIAAAPELLEALKEIVGFWDTHVPTNLVSGMHAKARAAIDKATQGETK